MNQPYPGYPYDDRLRILVSQAGLNLFSSSEFTLVTTAGPDQYDGLTCMGIAEIVREASYGTADPTGWLSRPITEAWRTCGAARPVQPGDLVSMWDVAYRCTGPAENDWEPAEAPMRTYQLVLYYAPNHAQPLTSQHLRNLFRQPSFHGHLQHTPIISHHIDGTVTVTAVITAHWWHHTAANQITQHLSALPGHLITAQLIFDEPPVGTSIMFTFWPFPPPAGAETPRTYD